jgi:hypothetical protein
MPQRITHRERGAERERERERERDRERKNDRFDSSLILHLTSAIPPTVNSPLSVSQLCCLHAAMTQFENDLHVMRVSGHEGKRKVAMRAMRLDADLLEHLQKSFDVSRAKGKGEREQQRERDRSERERGREREAREIERDREGRTIDSRRFRHWILVSSVARETSWNLYVPRLKRGKRKKKESRERKKLRGGRSECSRGSIKR